MFNISANVPTLVQCSIYVDDFILYAPGTKLPFIELKLHMAIDGITTSCDSRDFQFFSTKTNVILYRGKREMANYFSPTLSFFDFQHQSLLTNQFPSPVPR